MPNSKIVSLHPEGVDAGGPPVAETPAERWPIPPADDNPSELTAPDIDATTLSEAEADAAWCEEILAGVPDLTGRQLNIVSSALFRR